MFANLSNIHLTARNDVSFKKECPLCQQTLINEDPALTVEGHDVYLCSQCDLRFSIPMRGPGADWYRQASPYVSLENEGYRPTPPEKLLKRWRHRYFFDLKLPVPGKLLEVGCGPGEFLTIAQDAGYQVTGIDFNYNAISIAREVYGIKDTHVVSIEDFIDGGVQSQFNVVCLFEVLEHLEDPLALISTISNELLVPGGFLIISTPSHRRRPQLYYPDIDEPPHHLTMWSERSLEVLFDHSGLEKQVFRRSPLRAQNIFHTTSASSHLVNANTRPYKGLRLIEFVADHFIAATLRLVLPRAGGFFIFAAGRKPRNEYGYQKLFSRRKSRLDVF